MNELTHFTLCPYSRSIRLLLGELGIEHELSEERPWEWRESLLAINPSGDLPVLRLDDGLLLCGAYAISEYFSDEMPRHPRDGGLSPIFPGSSVDRGEVRRLVDWFHRKLDREVTRELTEEKVYVRFRRGHERAPDAGVLRALRANLRYHLSYISFLADQRRWLAGDDLSFADFAAAAHLSVADYLSEVPWSEAPVATDWYQRIKSRPSFRSLLSDRVPGVAPPPHYTAFDF